MGMVRSGAVAAPEVNPHHTHFERMLIEERAGCSAGPGTEAYCMWLEGCVVFSSFIYLVFVYIFFWRAF